MNRLFILKRYISNLISYFFAKKKNITIVKENRVAYFEISSNKYHRHLFNFIYWLIAYGYQVKIKYSTKLLMSLNQYARKILLLKNLQLSLKNLEKGQLYFTDKQTNPKQTNGIFLNSNYFEQTNINSYHVPLGMHPLVYFRGYYKEADKLRHNKIRNIRILFSGNVNKEFYGNGQIEKKFGKISRYNIYKILKEKFDSNTLVDGVDRNRLFSNNYDKHVIFNNSAQYEMLIKDYFPILSRSAFYLFCPGVTHPICHNNFESMSVGCIPILQYPEYFYPNLEHGINCIVFKDKKDLLSKIEYVLTMPENDIAKLRNNVNQYYELHLSIEGVINNVIISAEKGINNFFIGLD